MQACNNRVDDHQYLFTSVPEFIKAAHAGTVDSFRCAAAGCELNVANRVEKEQESNAVVDQSLTCSTDVLQLKLLQAWK